MKSPFRRLLPLLALLLPALLPSPARAQALADKVPANAIFYLGWRGADDLGPSYPTSHLKAILDASQLNDLLTQTLPALKAYADQNAQNDQKQVLDVFSSIAPIIWKRPTAIYFGGIDLDGPVGPSGHFAIICDAGPDAKSMLDSVNAALAKDPNDPFSTKAYGNLVVVSMGPDVDNLLSGQAPQSLADNPAFKSALAQVQPQAALTLYVDLHAAVQLANNLVDFQASDSDKKTFATLRSALAIDQLQQLIITQGLDGKDWQSQFFLASPAPRTGPLASLLNAQPLAPELLESIPVDAQKFVIARLDLSARFSAIRDTLNKIDPNAQAQFDNAVAKINQSLGFDLQKDLLAPIGSEWALYASPNQQGQGLLGAILLGQPADSAAVQKSLLKLQTDLEQQFAKNMDPSSRVTVHFDQTTSNNLNIHYLATPVLTPSWAVSNGIFYAGLYPQTVAVAAATTQSIIQSDGFESVRKRLNVDKPIAFWYVDLPKTAQNSYQLLLLASHSLAGFADLIGIKSPPLLLPALADFQAQLAPAGGAAWVDDAGLHAKSIQPYPLACLLHSASAQILSPLGITTFFGPVIKYFNTHELLSYLNQDPHRDKLRFIARSVYDAVDLAQPCDALLPPSLEDLVWSQRLPLQVILPDNLRVPVNLPSQQAILWVHDNSAYAYCGQGLTLRDLGPTGILCYEKSPLADGNYALFADLSVRWIPQSQLEATLALQSKLPRETQLNRTLILP